MTSRHFNKQEAPPKTRIQGLEKYFFRSGVSYVFKGKTEPKAPIFDKQEAPLKIRLRGPEEGLLVCPGRYYNKVTCTHQ